MRWRPGTRLNLGVTGLPGLDNSRLGTAKAGCVEDGVGCVEGIMGGESARMGDVDATNREGLELRRSNYGGYI